MENYEIIRHLGGGSFADVYLGKELSTSDLVAIKILKKKYRKLDQCYELREVQSLQKLCKDNLSSQKGYENIIKLKQIIFDKKTGKLNLVFEYMETDLYELMKKRSPNRLTEDEIKNITYQILLGLYHMHKYGFFHRDMKPENLLLTGNKLKIADFGLAREIRSLPPFTEYVSTRYYRAPECILRSQNYNSPIDIWAVGCIMAEMYMHPMPLFYGASEKDVFNKICTILGSPNKSNWNEGVNQACKIGFKYPQSTGTDLANIVIGASPEAIDLMKQMLKWSPNARATAASLLNHPFFNGCDLKKSENNNSNYFNDFGDVKLFNKTNRRFRPNNNNNEKNEKDEKKIENKKDNEENAFSKLLNDTEGFNKLLNQLKKEENEENKNFEKNNYKYNNNANNNNKNKNDFNDENIFEKKSYVNKINNNNNKKIINEEKENDTDTENYNNNNLNKKNINDNYNDFNFDFNENKVTNKEKETNNDFDYLFNSDKKINLRNFGLKDDFRKDSFNKKKDEYDYLFNEKKSREDKYDELFKKNNEKDISNIDSEINKILSKEIPLKNTKDNFRHRNNQNTDLLNNDMNSNMFRYKSQKISRYNGFELDKPYEISNSKPSIINGGRRQGGGLKALGYEPNKKSVFSEFNLGLGLNRKKENFINLNKYGYKNEFNPIVIKEKKSENYYGYNNNYNKEDKYGGINNSLGNNYNFKNLGRKDKFNIYEKNNQLFNQFSGDIIGNSRRKRNGYNNSNNNIGWGI